jgi:hypothetical protein
MVNKMKILPLDHFLLVMQKLAHFHGRWLTFRWMGEAGSLPQVTPPLSLFISLTFCQCCQCCGSVTFW